MRRNSELLAVSGLQKGEWLGGGLHPASRRWEPSLQTTKTNAHDLAPADPASVETRFENLLEYPNRRSIGVKPNGADCFVLLLRSCQTSGPVA